MNQFLAETQQIFTGAAASPTRRWSGVDFFDKAIFAQSSVAPRYWPGVGVTRPVPGLPDSTGYDGVTVIGGHLVFWKDENLIWSDVNDFTTYIPVGLTAVSFRAKTAADFAHPGSGDITDFIYLDRSDGMFVAGQFVRAEINTDDVTAATYHFYQVVEANTPVGVTGTTIGVSQSILATETGRIYLNGYAAWPVGGKLLVNGIVKEAKITAGSRNITPTFTSTSTSETVPAVGQVFHINIAENPSTLKVGDVLSVGGGMSSGADLYEVTQVAFTLGLKRLGVGASKQAQGYKFAAGTILTYQHSVTIQNTGTSTFSLLPGADITCQGSLTLRGLAYTGEMVPGATVPKGTTLASVDANEAGSAVTAGSGFNGSILAVLPLGEDGIIFKERSVSTFLAVGRSAGVFQVKGEIPDEGLISRNAAVPLTDNTIVFLGHRELYKYQGGKAIEPICQQHTIKLFAELNRTRASEIILYHNEGGKQLWIVYPTLTGETKVLIHNYREGSVVIDKYDAAMNGITAVGAVDWEIAPTWNDMDASRHWNTETLRWYQYVDDGLQRYTILCTGGDAAVPALGDVPGTVVPRLLLHGRKYSRTEGDNCQPEAYYAIAETQDFDFGDSRSYKYIDTVEIDAEVRETLGHPTKLFVQLGARESLQSDVRWTDPQAVDVSGSGIRATKFNLRSSGRFLRVRFFSQSVDAQWRIARFTLIGRMGGAY